MYANGFKLFEDNGTSSARNGRWYVIYLVHGFWSEAPLVGTNNIPA